MNTSKPENGNSTEAEPVSASSTADNKAFAIIGYILPFLFFLPLLNETSKHEPFARFHANQQLILLIIVVAASFVSGILTMVLMSLGFLINQLINLAIIVLAVIGAYRAYKGEMKELPFVGQFKILK
ncbi:DUF4870 domain-containing protein [Candidatus Nomurabacteria bacterium]|nr:DUF4870 domain-containing protein [Candidatus Nomurabacteria bacterium]